MVKTYVKKPVRIKAIQWTGDNETDIMFFVGKRLQIHKPPSGMENDKELPAESWRIIIPTLEGEMTASKGDYIICGVSGEHYPCKPSIFDKTYELVPDA